MSEKKSAPKSLKDKSGRIHRKTVSFNEMEIRTIEKFIDRYKIKNKSKFFRESIISVILQKSEEDHPTLF